MKKIIFLSLIISIVSINAFAQQESVDDCVQRYQEQQAKGFNALALAIDNGYFICGFAFGSFSKQAAAKQALAECESNRLSPNNEVDGKRKVMTHCRIHRFNIIDE